MCVEMGVLICLELFYKILPQGNIRLLSNIGLLSMNFLDHRVRFVSYT